MNEEINWETMKKIAWVAAVVLLSVAAFLFFWKQKYRSVDSTVPVASDNRTQEEIEKEKIDKMYAKMKDGYISTLTGEIKNVDLGKGEMEIESNQVGEELKTFQVSFDSKTKFIKTVYSMGDIEAVKDKSYEEAIMGEQETIKTDKSVLVPGIFVDVEAEEMFQPKETDSIRAVNVSLSRFEISEEASNENVAN